jgi:hypothetical protein
VRSSGGCLGVLARVVGISSSSSLPVTVRADSAGSGERHVIGPNVKLNTTAASPHACRCNSSSAGNVSLASISFPSLHFRLCDYNCREAGSFCDSVQPHYHLYLTF